MKSFIPYVYAIFFSVAIICSCEEEKTEYKRYLDDDDWFGGFSEGCFTIHEQSIGYFNPDSGKVFPDVFMYQNGRELGKGIHSFIPGFYDSEGIISIEEENKIEFVDSKNLLSIGSIEITQPRNLYSFNENILVSYGSKPTGGIALINGTNKKTQKTIQTAIDAGKIYGAYPYYYLFSKGVDKNDSMIVKLYLDDYTDFSRLQMVENIVIGSRPVDFEEINLDFDSQHQGLAILCLGDGINPAFIVIFDLISQKVRGNYHFAENDFKPENLFWIGARNSNKRIMATCANGKVYQLQFTEPITANVLINKNLSEFFMRNDRYYSVSKDTLSDHSQLYTIDAESLEIIDSTTIEPRAKFVTGGYF
jgi:hypothetical protein